MTNSPSRWYLRIVFGIPSCLMGLTAQYRASQVRFGLEFRGGYEIYYVVSPAADNKDVSTDSMPTTAIGCTGEPIALARRSLKCISKTQTIFRSRWWN